MENIDKLIDERLAADSDFQSSLTDLSDEEKNPLIEAKRKEVLASEFEMLRAKAEKADKSEEVAKNQKTRAEKAEQALKEKAAKEGDMSSTDLYALMEAKVPKDDIEEVREYAALKKITVAEALNSSIVKTILAEKAENRKTAAATTTRSTRTTQAKDGNSILQDIAQRGEDAIPEPGSEEAEAIYKARHQRKNPAPQR